MRMNEWFTKGHLFLFLAIGWFVFSSVYILRDQWQEFQNRKLSAAYQQGYEESVLKLLAESGKCNPITVYQSDKKMVLIEVSCLSAAEQTITDEHANQK